MNNKYLIFLLGFEVSMVDRRTREQASSFIVVPSPEEFPEELKDVYDAIKGYYSRLGYEVKEIRHQESKVKELDLIAEYNTAPTTAEYAE